MRLSVEDAYMEQRIGLPNLLYQQIVSVARRVKDMTFGLFGQPSCRRWWSSERPFLSV